MLFLNMPQPPFHTHLPFSLDGPQKIFVMVCSLALEGAVDGDIPKGRGLEVIPLHQETTAKMGKSKYKAKPSSGECSRLNPDGKDDNLELSDSYYPGYKPRKGFGVDPNDEISSVDGIVCRFTKMPQIRMAQIDGSKSKRCNLFVPRRWPRWHLFVPRRCTCWSCG